MVRELKEIVAELADIDTTVDIEDVQCIAGMMSDADIKIRALREFLMQLSIKAEPDADAEIMQILDRVYAPTPKTTTVIPLTTPSVDDDIRELLDCGFSEEQILAMKKLYDARKTAKKMSFVVCMKTCKFVTDKLDNYKNRTLKAKIVPLLQEYLKVVDPNTEYLVCNVHDFLKGTTLGNISKNFFIFENGYLRKV